MSTNASALTRAWSIFELKSIDEEQRIITGIASTPSTDRMGDIVEPTGAKFKLPLPLLWQHDSKSPVGSVLTAKPTKSGIPVSVQIAKTDESGPVKDLLDKAWQNVKLRLVRGFSIGFSALESEPIDPKNPWGGQRFLSWEWLELSLVTIPANADCSIQTIKALDTGAPEPAAAPGRSTSEPPAGASASHTRRVSTRSGAKPMKKSYVDMIADCVAARKEKTDRLDAILAKSAEAGVTLSDAEAEDHDTLDAEVKALDAQLVRLRAAEAREKAAATVVAGTSTEVATQARTGAVITVDRKLPPGIMFARYAMCVGMSRGNPFQAKELARQYYGDNATPIERTIDAVERGVFGGRKEIYEKSPVAGGSTTGSHYLDDMVPYNVMNDFIEFLRAGSIIGKFGGANPGGGANYPSLRRVGFNERVSGMSTGFVAAWKGEGLPAIPTAAVTFNTQLLYNNLAALAILTKEAIRFSNPAAEARVRDDLARAVNGKMDLDFIDPGKAASGTTSPASITNAVAATAPTGTDAGHLVSDMATLLKLFTTNNLDMSDVVLIMSASQALEISMMTTTLGMTYFPGITAQGGNFRGIPVITSEYLAGVGSPSVNSIVAVKAGDVYLADDGVVTVDASDQASVEMVDSSSQSAISGTGASLVSLWQTGAVGLMATREVTWKKRRSTACQYISPAAYVA